MTSPPPQSDGGVYPPFSSPLFPSLTSAAAPSPTAVRVSSGLDWSHPNSTTLTTVAVGIGIGGTIVLVAVGIFALWYKRRNRHLVPLVASNEAPPPPPEPREDLFDGHHQHWRRSPLPRPYNRAGLPPRPPTPGPTFHNKKSSTVFSTPSGSYSVSLSSSVHSDERPFSHLSGLSLNFSNSTITYEELELATDGFSSTNLLGVGGFGHVHKGVLSNGTEVAVKRLKLGSGQGEREFQSEVETYSRVHHKNLVSLVGYCSYGAERLLVYEFVPNGTLDFHLHGKTGQPINWATRMKVAVGSAKGLAYLHGCKPNIIHRDIKTANILLDNNFEAKVADFGLARFNHDTDTHVSTRVIGTFGYIAPDYVQTGQLTMGSDVFSFGVMLLELITGRRPVENKEDPLVVWARPLLTRAVENGNFDSLADARLLKDYDSTEMSRLVTCADVCLRPLARHRPHMNQIVRALEGSMLLDELKENCITPGHTVNNSLSSNSDNLTGQNMTEFIKTTFEDMEFNADEYNVSTSESIQQQSGSSSERRSADCNF